MITFVAGICRAQTKGTVKLHAFKQSVAQGKAPEVTDGPQVSERQGKNYFIYAVSPSRIYPSEIWIEGERYGVSVTTITQTPVEQGDDRNIGAPKKVLVPKTTQKVIQLVPIPAVEEKSFGANAKSQAKTNDVVLVYKQNGKFYYKALKRMSDLEGAYMQ